MSDVSPDMLPLEGKVSLVTGSSRGLGKGIALVLAEQGSDVAINYRTKVKDAETVAQMIRNMGRRALIVQADVSRETAVREMFVKILAAFGRLDILVNNAGTTQSRTIEETSLEDWDFILRTNLTSTFLCSREAVSIMKERGGGRIVNISSITGQRGALYGHVHYAASKSGQVGFAKTLARTVAPHNITVNAIAPGIIETELLFQTHGKADVKALAKSVPLGLGSPRDVGLAAAFLCGEGGRYITGATIDVNGGMYMR